MFNYSLTDPIFLYVFSSLKKLKLSMYSLQARGGSLFLSGWRLWLPGKSNFHPHPGHATGSEDPEEKLADEAFQGCCDSIKSIFLCWGVLILGQVLKYTSSWGQKSKRSCIIPLCTPPQLWKHTFNRLLVALAIFDLMFVCSTVPIHVFPLFEYNNRIFALLYSRSKFFQFLKNISPLIHIRGCPFIT